MSEAVNKYRSELEQDDDGRWSAWIEDLPGCGAWGCTRDEVLTALMDAAIAYVEDMVEEAGEFMCKREKDVQRALKPSYKQSRKRRAMNSRQRILSGIQK